MKVVKMTKNENKVTRFYTLSKEWSSYHGRELHLVWELNNFFKAHKD